MEEFSKFVNNLVFSAYSVYPPATNIQYLRRQGKNIFELGRGHLQVHSRVSRTKFSFKLTKLCVDEVYLSGAPYLVSKIGQSCSKTWNSPICVPPGEKSIWLRRFTPACTCSPKLMKFSSTLTKLQSYESHVQPPPSWNFQDIQPPTLSW